MVNDDIFTRRHQKTRIGAAEIKCFSSPTLRERKKKVMKMKSGGRFVFRDGELGLGQE